MRPGSAPTIELAGISREFAMGTARQTLFRMMSDSLHGTRTVAGIRHALVDVSLRAGQGDRIALIGNNAAGKSTLLKIIAGLLRPTRGTVTVRGEMVLLTSLGLGMIDEVSVLDNTLLYGALYGVEPARMRGIFPDIMEWAEITGYENALLKTLSTGTRARLAFSVVRHIATEIFLIDEALSAGDVAFRAKCRAFFDEPRNRDRTFLVATHDMDFARSFCTSALWLHQGRVMACGASGMVVEQYLDAQARR